LADGITDPRPEIMALLKKHIGPLGTILAYHQSFEIVRLKEMASVFPEFEPFVSGLLPRFVDLEAPFRSFWYYHPKQRGSSSIKCVLPVLVPELSYAEMEIGDGGTASSEYARVTFGDAPEEERNRVRSALLDYCRLDTLAMVRIVEKLRQLTEAAGA